MANDEKDLPVIIHMLRDVRDSQEHPIAKLLYSIIDVSLTDLYRGWLHRYKPSYMHHGQKIGPRRLAAQHWFISRRKDFLSFHWICEKTGLDKEKFLKQLSKEGWLE